MITPKTPPQLLEIPYAREFLQAVLDATDFDFADEVVTDVGLHLSEEFGKRIGSSRLDKLLFAEMRTKSQEIIQGGYIENGISHIC